MRILHFITSLRTGGAERLVIDLLPRLAARGHEVGLLLMDGTRTHFFDMARQRGTDVQSLSEGQEAMHDVRLSLPLRRLLHRQRYDIVHTHNTPCQILAALAAPRSTRLVTTEHNTSNRRRASFAGRWADRMLYARYSAIIACGDETARSLSAWLPRLTPKIHTVANGIDTAAFAAAAPAADIAGWSRGRHIITMAAAFRPQKDHATALRALARLSADYALVLAGDGETMPANRALAETLGIADRVLFAGVRPDIPAVYAASDIAILSTHYEGFGLSAVEAMAAGLPLVASDVDGLRHAVSPAARFFPESDDAALARCLEEICSDRSLHGILAGRSLARAADFSIESTAEGYNRIYTNLK